MMTALLAAMLIPPPPGWAPPQATGPGLLCGNRYGLDLTADERATMEWPGEVFLNDIYSTYHVRTPGGEVTITENGVRTRPPAGRRDGRAGTRIILNHGGGVYSVQLAASGDIRAVTLRFPAGIAVAARRAMLSRLRFDAAPARQCLSPDNRP